MVPTKLILPFEHPIDGFVHT